MNHGRNVMERPVETVLPLEYEVHVGAASLRGCGGRVVRREDGFYLEPMSGGLPIILGSGQTASSPVRLSPGDSFRMGEFTFTFNI